MEFDFHPTAKPGARLVGPATPMRLLLLGDFGGRGAFGRGDVASLGTRSVLRVDVDNFDRVMAGLKPSWPLAVASGPPVDVPISTLDDFHPDRLLRQIDPLRSLAELRERLQDPSSFTQAAADVRVALSPAARAGDPGALPAKAAESDAGLVERILGRSPGAAPAAGATAGASDIEAFIRAIVAPHVVADTTSPQRTQYVEAVDAAMGEQLRMVLHAEAFQALEANWRGLRWLLANLDLDEELEIHLLDITAAELLDDAKALHADAQSSVLWRLLVDRPAADSDEQQWAALVALFDVGASSEALTWLAALGAIGAQAGAPILATADPSLLGLPRFDDLPDPRDWPGMPATEATFWQALRQSELAPWIGLAAPRLLMRQPYGAKSDPVEGITFEEFIGPPGHAQLLWAPAALGCALLLGQAFRESRWQMQPGDAQQIGDLPACIVERDGERRLQPCAEVLLSERAAQALTERGIMAVASYKDRAEARLVRFQSIAQPACALSGPWP